MQTAYTFIYFHPIFHGNIHCKEQTNRHSTQKLTQSLNRRIQKGYSFETAVRSSKISIKGINIG